MMRQTIFSVSLAACVLLLCACQSRTDDARGGVVVVEPFEPPYRCTQVIGFSQTSEWFMQGVFEALAGDGYWQLLWASGAGIERWAAPRFVGWSNPVVSPCRLYSDRPDRVVLNISTALSPDVSSWARQIQAAVTNIRERYPDARRIVLQPVVGGPDGGLCLVGEVPVRASRHFPLIVEAIEKVLAEDESGLLAQGAAPTVSTCADYQDRIGHLSAAARGSVALAIGSYYRERDGAER